MHAKGLCQHYFTVGYLRKLRFSLFVILSEAKNLLLQTKKRPFASLRVTAEVGFRRCPLLVANMKPRLDGKMVGRFP